MSKQPAWQRDLVHTILKGEEVWVHSDLELDPVTAHVLELVPRGAAVAKAIPTTFDRTYEDYRHTLLAVCRIVEGEQGRIAELEQGIRDALNYLANVREADRFSEVFDAADDAHNVLTRVL